MARMFKVKNLVDENYDHCRNYRQLDEKKKNMDRSQNFLSLRYKKYSHIKLSLLKEILDIITFVFLANQKKLSKARLRIRQQKDQVEQRNIYASKHLWTQLLSETEIS